MSIVVLFAKILDGGGGGLVDGGTSSDAAFSMSWKIERTCPMDLAALADISSLKPDSAKTSNEHASATLSF